MDGKTQISNSSFAYVSLVSYGCYLEFPLLLLQKGERRHFGFLQMSLSIDAISIMSPSAVDTVTSRVNYPIVHGGFPSRVN